MANKEIIPVDQSVALARASSKRFVLASLPCSFGAGFLGGLVVLLPYSDLLGYLLLAGFLLGSLIVTCKKHLFRAHRILLPILMYAGFWSGFTVGGTCVYAVMEGQPFAERLLEGLTIFFGFKSAYMPFLGSCNFPLLLLSPVLTVSAIMLRRPNPGPVQPKVLGCGMHGSLIVADDERNRRETESSREASR